MRRLLPLSLKGQGLPASSSTFEFSTGLNSTQSAPTTLLPNPSSTLRGTWYRQLTCIPDQASLKVNGCQEIAVKADIVDLGGAKVMNGVRFIPSPEGDGSSLPLYPNFINAKIILIALNLIKPQ